MEPPDKDWSSRWSKKKPGFSRTFWAFALTIGFLLALILYLLFFPPASP